MKKQVGTFAVQEAFQVTGRGWFLTGEINGEVFTGNQLVFESGAILIVSDIETVQSRSFSGKSALRIAPQFASRQELVDQKIIGATAQILE